MYVNYVILHGIVGNTGMLGNVGKVGNPGVVGKARQVILVFLVIVVRYEYTVNVGSAGILGNVSKVQVILIYCQ